MGWDGMCRRCLVRLLNRADAAGDGALVNAICWYARERFGPGLHW
jgi:hypothetical protein